VSLLIKLGAAMPGAPDVDHPRPERLVQGNPRRETWNCVDSAIGAGRVYMGVRIQMGPAEQELFTVLQGRCRVHGADGSVQEAGPGEAIVIPPGFSGSFEVLETVVKTYAIVEGTAAPG